MFKLVLSCSLVRQIKGYFAKYKSLVLFTAIQ